LSNIKLQDIPKEDLINKRLQIVKDQESLIIKASEIAKCLEDNSKAIEAINNELKNRDK
jgi:hypothetical protein